MITKNQFLLHNNQLYNLNSLQYKHFLSSSWSTEAQSALAGLGRLGFKLRWVRSVAPVSVSSYSSDQQLPRGIVFSRKNAKREQKKHDAPYSLHLKLACWNCHPHSKESHPAKPSISGVESHILPILEH